MKIDWCMWLCFLVIKGCGFTVESRVLKSQDDDTPKPQDIMEMFEDHMERMKRIEEELASGNTRACGSAYSVIALNPKDRFEWKKSFARIDMRVRYKLLEIKQSVMKGLDTILTFLAKNWATMPLMILTNHVIAWSIQKVLQSISDFKINGGLKPLFMILGGFLVYLAGAIGWAFGFAFLFPHVTESNIKPWHLAIGIFPYWRLLAKYLYLFILKALKS